MDKTLCLGCRLLVIRFGLTPRRPSSFISGRMHRRPNRDPLSRQRHLEPADPYTG
jgi:hypothetical protein